MMTTEKSHWRILLAIGALALLLRLGVGMELLDHPSVTQPDPRTDMATYERIATEILAGQWPDYYYYQPFYYAVFLPAVHSLFGLNDWSVPLVQALLGAAAVLLAGALGTELFGKRTGILAAVLLALTRFHLFYTPFRLMAVLLSFELILFAFLLLRAMRKGGWGRWLGAAAMLACATLTRGNCVLLLPLLLGLVLWQNRASPPQAALLSLLILLVFYLPQLPFAMRNYEYYGRWTGPSSAADAVLALSNSPQAPPGGLEPDTRVYREWMQDARAEGAERVPVSHQVLTWIGRHPAAFVELKWQTFLLFWTAAEIPNNVAMAHEGEDSVLLRLPFPLMLDFAVIGSLAIAGLLLSLPRLQRSPACLAAFLLIGLGCAATVLFYMLARFRVPLLPLLCVFAAYAIHCFLSLGMDLLEGKPLPRSRIYGVAAALVAGTYLCNAAFVHYQQIEPAVQRLVRPNGTAFETDEGAIVHDHGPRLTGGWKLGNLPPGVREITKEFVLPHWLRSRDWQEITLEVGQANPRQGGWEWLRVSADPELSMAKKMSFSFALPAEQQSLLIFDDHRNYGRTRLANAGGPGRAELVARIVLIDGPETE